MGVVVNFYPTFLHICRLENHIYALMQLFTNEGAMCGFVKGGTVLPVDPLLLLRLFESSRGTEPSRTESNWITNWSIPRCEVFLTEARVSNVTNRCFANTVETQSHRANRLTVSHCVCSGMGNGLSDWWAEWFILTRGCIKIQLQWEQKLALHQARQNPDGSPQVSSDFGVLSGGVWRYLIAWGMSVLSVPAIFFKSFLFFKKKTMRTYWTQFVQIIEKHSVHTEKRDAPAYGHPTYSLQHLGPTHVPSNSWAHPCCKQDRTPGWTKKKKKDKQINKKQHINTVILLGSCGIKQRSSLCRGERQNIHLYLCPLTKGYRSYCSNVAW